MWQGWQGVAGVWLARAATHEVRGRTHSGWCGRVWPYGPPTTATPGRHSGAARRVVGVAGAQPPSRRWQAGESSQGRQSTGHQPSQPVRGGCDADTGAYASLGSVVGEGGTGFNGPAHRAREATPGGWHTSDTDVGEATGENGGSRSQGEGVCSRAAARVGLQGACQPLQRDQARARVGPCGTYPTRDLGPCGAPMSSGIIS